MAPHLIWCGKQIPQLAGSDVWQTEVLPRLLPEIGVVPTLVVDEPDDYKYGLVEWGLSISKELYPMPSSNAYAPLTEWDDWLDSKICAYRVDLKLMRDAYLAM